MRALAERGIFTLPRPPLGDNIGSLVDFTWSSLSEGADLEMLLVFEGSDGIMK